MLRSSTTSFFLVVSTTVSDFTGLPTTAPTRSMSVCWRRKCKKSMPEAVERGRDGYLRVYYDKLGLRFQTYRQWIASGAQVGPAWQGNPCRSRQR